MSTNQNTGRFEHLRRSLYRSMTRNIGLKLTSLLLAVVLWFSITGGPKSETTISVPLDLSSAIPNGWALAEEYIGDIEVTISGRPSVVQRIANSELARSEIRISPNADLIEADTELQRLRISAKDVFARNVNVIRVHPGEILLRLDRETSVRKEVEITLLGVLPDGYVLHTNPPETRPESVRISGAESRIPTGKINAALDLGTIVVTRPEEISKSIILQREPLLQYDVREIEVILDVVEVSETKRVNVSAFRYSGINAGSEQVQVITPQSVSWEITGPRSWLENIDASNTYMLLNLENTVRNQQVRYNINSSMIKFELPPERVDLLSFKLLSRNDYLSLRIDSN